MQLQKYFLTNSRILKIEKGKCFDDYVPNGFFNY